MKEQNNKKAIYYYYDGDGNRRLWSVTNLNETVVSLNETSLRRTL